ncbi:MAG: LTA synthase family protein [Lachnospiraceae bacterium]|nr:LTA synthase family protein [Lachnospiraceae bacterium]
MMRKKDDRIFEKKSDKHGVYLNKSNERRNRKNRIRRQQEKEKSGFEDLIDKYQTDHSLKHYLILYAVLPVIMVFIYECLGYKSITGGFQFLVKHPWAYLCNVMIISTSFTLALLFKKQLCVVMAICLIWTLCAFGNFVLLCNRVTPLTGNDLTLITDAFGIVAKYLNGVQMALLILVIILAVLGIAATFFKAPAACRKVNYVKSVLTIAAMAALTWGIFAVSWNVGGVETQFHELSQSYKKNGFVYCFVNSLVDVGVRKPKDYSPEVIETLMESPENTEDKKETQEKPSHVAEDGKSPNIIVVQLESFFNINRLANVTFSRNPIANFTNLMKSGGSGHFNVPVIGAGTVNSEFEVLTGMNIDDFGAGEYPYKTILKSKTCETLAYNLLGNGYSSHAIHNHVGSFYDRNKVYSNMGFETFTSLEYMWPKAYTPMNWAKDVVLTEEIKKALDSTKNQDFVYAVSVQGHGSYPSDPETDYERHVTVSSSVIEDEAYLNQISYYANQLYEMDQFIGQLVKMLKESDEETILVMYGDHLPSLNLSDESLVSGTIYQTEYFIWNNMGLKFEKQDVEAYELSSILLEAVNVQDGVINTYHQKYKKQVKEGLITQEKYLEGLKELEYDILYGEQLCYNGIDPYAPTELQMGIDPITISNVQAVSDGSIKVHGRNFTRYSKVYVNEKACDTWYITPLTLQVEDMELEPGDEIEVRQKSLSSTEKYIYQKELLENESESEEESSDMESSMESSVHSRENQE